MRLATRCVRLIASCALLAGAFDATALEPGPAPGRLVDVGGHHLHIHCVGQGAPTVVLDAGLGGSSLDWQPVMRVLGQRQRVCGYDRAGMGWSEPGPQPRTASRSADELFMLLLGAREEPPFVLVGHSYGGYTAQLFARRYAYLVAGVVLVDASHAEQVERFAAPPVSLNIAPRRLPGAVQRVRYDTPRLPEGVPEDLREQAMALMVQPKARRAMTDEYLWFRDSAAELREAPAFPPVPLVVLSHGRPVWPDSEHGARAERLWLELQAELAALSPHSAHILGDRSSHHIPLDQPALVADAASMVADFAERPATGVGRVAARAEASRHAQWLAFEHATWLSDRLRQGLGLERPALTPAMQRAPDAGALMRIGHFIGTGQPARQQRVYFDASQEGCAVTMPGSEC